MQSALSKAPTKSQKPIFAILKIVDSELTIFPVADSDQDLRLVWDALRFFCEDCK